MKKYLVTVTYRISKDFIIAAESEDDLEETLCELGEQLNEDVMEYGDGDQDYDYEEYDGNDEPDYPQTNTYWCADDDEDGEDE